jgi:signal transduction histidine kinase
MLGEHADPDDPEVAELVGLARRQLALARLRLQRFSRLEGLPVVPQLQTTDLVELARTLVADLTWSVLADHPTHVRAPDPVTAEVDPSLIRQLLFNLLTNAARYSPKGREIIVAVVSANDHREIRVRDRGHGVAPEDAERIFQRYERGDTPERGSGIGLAVSSEIAEAHEGELVLEPAEDDEGSTFLVRLPIVAA